MNHNTMVSKHFIFVLTVALVLNIGLSAENNSRQSKAPFLQTDIIHPTRSEFELNLIFNENRQVPIILVQYSKQPSYDLMENIIKNAFIKQRHAAFALAVDCRDFAFDMSNSIGICSGFDKKIAEEEEQADKKIPQDQRVDRFFRVQFMIPNPKRIKEKGHILSKNHDTQNLRQAGYQLNGQFLAKIIRNQLADFVSYIQDSYDMDEFLQIQSQFRQSKQAKLLLFDQNLQAPTFLKKLAAKLDGKMKVGVTDNFKMAKKYQAFSQVILLMQYNLTTNKYETSKIQFVEGKQIQSIIAHQSVSKYLKLKKYRDMVLDFQHRNHEIYNFSTIQEINQLISYGRLIYLQISQSQREYVCPEIQEIGKKYEVFFNYVCFKSQKSHLLVNSGIPIEQNQLRAIFIIDKLLSNAEKIIYESSQTFDAYEYLPGTPPRQKVSALSQAELCLKTAATSKRDPVFYWYDSKQNKRVIRLLQYFNSMPEVTSLVHFCQIYLPDDDMIKTYSLVRNSLFSMMNMNNKGEMQKFQFKQALQFSPVKMFLRQLSVNQMLKVYDQKLLQNNIKQINSAEDLTNECFRSECIVALMATNRFRFESEMQTLKQLKLKMSDMGYNFVWTDGICHWDVAKQLKLLGKKQKIIDRSYLFYYQQKSNNYSLMKSIEENKYWVEKDVKKWLKNFKSKGQIKRMKFGIDIQDKKCVNQIKSKKEKNDKKNKKQEQISSDEL